MTLQHDRAVLTDSGGVESLLAEARRRARTTVLEELVAEFVRHYREELAAYLATPEGRPRTGRAGAPGQPGRRPATPGEPGRRPATPGEPGRRPATPGEPGREPAAPGEPGRKPSVPGEPGGEPAAPGEPGRRPATPGEPGTSGEPAPTGGPGTPATGRDGELAEAWYVYSVVRRHDLGDLPLGELAGIEGRAVTLVECGDLAAVAACVPLAGFRRSEEEPDVTEGGWLATAVRSHEAVVEEVFAHATVLPFRFGALYRTADDVAAVLREDNLPLRSELFRLEGAAEWGVKAFLDGASENPPRAAATAGALSTASDPVEPGNGTAWMLRRRDAALARSTARGLAEQVAGEAHEALSRNSRESVLQDRPRRSTAGVPALDGAYLVERTSEERFREGMCVLSDRYAAHGLRFHVTGPWPPYHFVRLPERVSHG